MECNLPNPEEIADLSIVSLGKAAIKSPLKLKKDLYIADSERILFYSEEQAAQKYFKKHKQVPSFEAAGPRKDIFFNPSHLTCGIVTCGGICPGINDVIRTITLTLQWEYGVKKVLGFRYGYEGVSSQAREKPEVLVPEEVEDIQHQGGTILGSSRGPQDPADMVDTLVKYKVGVLFVIGGDGTFRGAHEICKEVKKRNLSISVIGIPKTIDNDIYCSETSFGFGTAVEKARESLCSAHEEAKSAYNGIGLVKLMGRDSGFIAATASLANSDVNFCLIPEVPFTLTGPDNFLKRLEKRLQRKNHAVIVVAEGAGQDLIKNRQQTHKDASGNTQHADIGIFLKEAIVAHFQKKKMPATIKYIDPSYTIRSCPANARDSVYCLMLGQNAVHAGMAGKTDMFIGYWNHHFTHVPLIAAVGKQKKINPNGIIWQTLKLLTE